MITDALAESLYNYIREPQYCDVIVDPLAGDEWSNCLGVATSDIQKIHLAHPYFHAGSDKSPLVMRVPSKHFEVITSLADMARKQAMDVSCQTRSVCAFVQTDLELGKLARILEKNLLLSVSGRKIYFRYFDPRVIHHLPRRLAPARLAMCGIWAWGYFDWEGVWSVLSFNDSNQNVRAINLSEDEWRPLQNIEHFNATVAGFKRAGLPCACSETERLWHAVQQAVGLGITEPEDVATYLVRSQQIGFPLMQHSRWSEALAFLTSSIPLSAVLDGLDLEIR